MLPPALTIREQKCPFLGWPAGSFSPLGRNQAKSWTSPEMMTHLSFSEHFGVERGGKSHALLCTALWYMVPGRKWVF